MELEIIMLSEVSQVQKEVCIFSLYVEDRSNNKYRHYHINITVQNISKSETDRGDFRLGKSMKKRE
jgi:hypothetical protein